MMEEYYFQNQWPSLPSLVELPATGPCCTVVQLATTLGFCRLNSWLLPPVVFAVATVLSADSHFVLDPTVANGATTPHPVPISSVE